MQRIYMQMEDNNFEVIKTLNNVFNVYYNFKNKSNEKFPFLNV